MSGRYGRRAVDPENYVAEVREQYGWRRVSVRPRLTHDEAMRDAATARRNYPHAQLRVRPLYGAGDDAGKARRPRQ